MNKSFFYTFFLAMGACMLHTVAHAELKPISKPIKTQGNVRTYLIERSPEENLTIDVFLPPHWEPGQSNPAIVLEPGMGGIRDVNRALSTYLASRGFVAIDGDRATQQARVSTVDCKSAVRWVRTNAKVLGVDPDRVLGGGESGGAACMIDAAFSHLESSTENLSISSKPNALVLFYPSKMIADTPVSSVLTMSDIEAELSKKSLPMIFFYGTNDGLMSQGLEVAKRTAALGNRTEFYVADGQGHGFSVTRNASNVNPWSKVVYYQTDLFLQSLGYLQGKPTVSPDSKLLLRKVDLSAN